MSTGSILNIDKIFKTMSNMTNESKRHLVGKYDKKLEEQYETDFTQSIYHYNSNKPICSNKFNFSPDGTKCKMCNSFSFLFDDGEIIPDEQIIIESGFFKGKRLMIKRFPNCETQFGKYRYGPVDLNSNLISINKIIKRQRMINESCEASHKFAISTLINTSEFPFKSNILCSWVCEYTNLVLFVSKDNLIKTLFTEKMMKDIFFQIFILSGTDTISHGSPSYENTSVMNEKSSYKMNGKKIDMDYTLFIEPCKYSSFTVDYANRKLYFVGKDSIRNIEEPNWNINYNLTNNKNIRVKLTDNPSMKDYLSMRVPSLNVSTELMNYIRFTGINVFPQLYFFLYVTIFLLNKSFYDLFTSSSIYTEFSKLFLENDLDNYLKIINENMGKELNEDEIVQLLIDCNLKIRLDLIPLLGSYMINLY